MPHDENSTSIWKKEMSFRRKSEQDSPDEEGGGTSIWKRDLSLRKKKEEGSTAAPELPAEPEPLVVEALEAAPDLEPEVTPEPEPFVPEPTPVVLAPAVPIEHDWLTQPLEEVSEPPAEPPILPIQPSVEPTPITLVPELDDEPIPAVVLEPEPELPPVALASAIPVLPPPSPEPMVPELPDVTVELPPVELPTAEVPTVEVSALELPLAVATAAVEVADKAPNVPFYKRDFSLKRKPRERTPKAERPKRERKAKATPEADKKKPFYKRELSAKRKPKQWDAAEPAAAFKPKLRRVPRPKPSLPGPVKSTKKIVGLKIGGSQIAAARIHNNGSPELVQAVRGPLEHGIVVGGELRDPEALAIALKDFFTLHKLPKRGVRLGIANNRIGVRTFEVVGIDDPKQLANAVRFRAQEVLPIPIEEAVLDFQVLSQSVNDEGQPVSRVLLVVAYRELVDRYIYACRKAGIQVVGIDLEAFALLRAVSEPHDPVAGTERGAVVAVSVGYDRSTFAVSDGRVCEFTRVLEWGGSALNVAIARALEISPSEAEPIKRSLSLTGSDEVPEGFTADQVATALEAARKQLQTFARELVSSLQFYQNQPGSLGIGEIALTGGTAHLPGLAAELERLIGVPVRVADPMGRVKVSKKLREVDQVGSLAIAIGLGIED